MTPAEFAAASRSFDRFLRDCPAIGSDALDIEISDPSERVAFERIEIDLVNGRVDVKRIHDAE